MRAKHYSRTIKATANYGKRTFTIRIQYNGVTSTKYRTLPMSEEEFNGSLYHTQNDWSQFLKSDDYYKVK